MSLRPSFSPETDFYSLTRVQKSALMRVRAEWISWHPGIGSICSFETLKQLEALGLVEIDRKERWAIKYRRTEKAGPVPDLHRTKIDFHKVATMKRVRSLLPEVRHWIEDNIQAGSFHVYGRADAPISFYFCDGVEATMFKLRWV